MKKGGHLQIPLPNSWKTPAVGEIFKAKFSIFNYCFLFTGEITPLFQEIMGTGLIPKNDFLYNSAPWNSCNYYQSRLKIMKVIKPNWCTLPSAIPYLYSPNSFIPRMMILLLFYLYVLIYIKDMGYIFFFSDSLFLHLIAFLAY